MSRSHDGRTDTVTPRKLSLSKNPSASIYIDTDTESHAIHVKINLVNKSLRLIGDDGEEMRALVEQAIRNRMDKPVTGDDTFLLERCAAPAIVVEQAIKDIENANGWSTAPHALTAVIQAVQDMKLDASRVVVQNFGF
jgi:hypothetical protein